MTAPNVFARVLGPRYAELAPRVRALHEKHGVSHGTAVVTGARSPLARLVRRLAGLPEPHPGVALAFERARHGDAEIWTRRFDAVPMTSTIAACGTELHERLGPFAMTFALTPEDGALRWRLTRLHAFGLRWPQWLARGVSAFEHERDGRYAFVAEARLPVVGLLVRYEGVLDVA